MWSKKISLVGLLFSLATLFILAVVASPVMAQINFVQVDSASTHGSSSSMTATYTSAQTAGNMNVVAIGWAFASITSVKDSAGNTYHLAVSQTASNNNSAIYYASNIVGASAGANTVTVNFNARASVPALEILEYSGVNSLDMTATATGNAATADSGPATTTQASELLFGADFVTSGSTTGPGTGYTSRVINNSCCIAEDQIVSGTGTYHATAAFNGTGSWIMQLATFYSSSGGGTPPPAPTNLTATAVSSSQINLSWTASFGASSYNILRSTTTGGPYAQIASSVTTTSYSDTSLAASTTYYYVTQAVNSAGTSGNSNQASATTQAPPPPPPPPTGLTATAVSSSQINLSWTASSGATSYNVLRSATTGGPYTQIVSGVTTTSFADTGLAASTTYFYVVRAVNNGGTSGNSNESSATTQAASNGSLPPADTHIWQSSFLPPWIANAWTSADWASDYQYMVNVRMDNEIWQWGIDENKGQAWYSTTLAGYSVVCKCVDLALPEAQAKGIKVWLGLNINKDWFHKYANDPTWLDNEFTNSINMVQDLWNLYGATYGNTILGFYQPFEVDNLNEMSSTAQQRMIAEYLRLANYIHTNTGKQLIVSPFFNDSLSTPAQYGAWWQTVVSQAPVDVISMQDGIGVGHSTLTDVGSWFQAVCAGIHAGRAASQCWANSETFAGTGGASNKPAPVSRVIQQLQAEQASVDRFTTYTYEQLDTPLVGDTTEYNDWLNYVSTQP